MSYVLNFLAALLGMHSVNKYTGTRHTTCMAVQKTAPATGLGLVLLNAKGSCAGSLYLQRKMRTVDYPGLRVEEAEARDRTGCQGCVHRWAAGSVLIEAWGDTGTQPLHTEYVERPNELQSGKYMSGQICIYIDE